jgi:hypothetical protein
MSCFYAYGLGAFWLDSELLFLSRSEARAWVGVLAELSH